MEKNTQSVWLNRRDWTVITLPTAGPEEMAESAYPKKPWKFNSATGSRRGKPSAKTT